VLVLTNFVGMAKRKPSFIRTLVAIVLLKRIERWVSLKLLEYWVFGLGGLSLA
jgi:hypothetical protein